ncbi:hypothetical protein [Pseudonocardia sp. 73-21]|uniref:hypothetical protein n=1 Tax=Pseudonocardia sp. 73-21 TaxID=1895809 RepID=UPI00262FE9F6|nr:hypothetical protein [Pseudonocardia sp. 73-21]
MTTPPRPVTTAASAVLLAVVAGCSTASPSPPPVPPPVVTTAPGDAALDAYREFWRIADAARAAPRTGDWTPRIEAVASGQALQTVLTDVRNYADLPAHTVGTITRTPTITAVTPPRVSILDCVDIGDTVLLSDKDGSRLDDAANRVRRFQLRADVVEAADGKWLVDTTTPELEQPC